jgi:membrane protein required for colicin V production
VIGWRGVLLGGYTGSKAAGRVCVNWVDLTIISVVGFSALLAFTRGLVREVLGIGSWVAAGFIAVWGFPYVRPHIRGLIGAGDVADVAGFGVVFLIALLVLTVLSGMIGGLVRTSVLGGVDRTFGVVFGLVRGAGVVVLAYIIAGMIIPLDAWPEPVQEARTLPYVYQGAVLVVSLLPPEYRPVVHIPPGGRETRAADLLRAAPQGRAVARP